jgi:hypothetical protein
LADAEETEYGMSAFFDDLAESDDGLLGESGVVGYGFCPFSRISSSIDIICCLCSKGGNKSSTSD